VRYEIFESIKRGNLMFGIHINGIKGKEGSRKAPTPSTVSHLNLAWTVLSLGQPNGRTVGGSTQPMSIRIVPKNNRTQKGDSTSNFRFGIRFMTGYKTMGTRTSTLGFGNASGASGVVWSIC